MKKLHIYIMYGVILCGALLTLAGCTSELGTTPQGGGQNGMMQVNLSILAADYTQATRAAGSVKGVEGIEEGSMQLLCFDKGGYFLGMGQDVTIAPCTDGDGHTHSLKATVYNSTARIHFLANAHVTMEPQWVGMGENTLLSRLMSQYDTHEHMVYWGYKKMGNAEQMKTFLESGSNTIYMLRDRAKVTVDFASNTSGITDIQVALDGGLDQGTMAPLDRTTLSFPEINSATDWQTSLGFISLPTSYTRLTLDESSFATEAFAYETENSSSEPLAAILKVTYRDGQVRYHKVFLQDSQYQNYTIRRNHTYRINVQRLNASYGYTTPQGAAGGLGSNDIWVNVDDIVSEINAGGYSLKIGNGQAGATSIVFTGTDSGRKGIPFTYSGDSQMTASDFECKWTANNGLTTSAQPTLSYAGAGKESSISFDLLPVTDNLSTAVLRLQDKKHGLSRNIKLYSISHFTFEPYDDDIRIGRSSGNEVNFKFSIPADYPEDLFPVTVKFASNDVNPRGIDVEVASTNEDPINKEWNCWFTMKCYQPGVYSVPLRNVRDKNAGDKGILYMKASYFGADASTVNRAIEIPVTFQ